MNNKILIGSIIAVVILVLVSFTGVVGYQSVKSTSAINSPLFYVRSSRAIDEESKDIASDYVGKGEESVLSIPKRDGRTALGQKFIDRISEMDDETSKQLITFLINYGQKDKRLNDVKPDKIREAFYLLRNSDKSIPMFNVIIKNKYQVSAHGGQTCYDCFTFGFGEIGCFFIYLLYLLMEIPWMIVAFISFMLNCES